MRNAVEKASPDLSSSCSSSRDEIRKQGVKRLSIGVAILVGTVLLMLPMGLISESYPVFKRFITVILLLGIAGVSNLAIGALQWMTRRTWSDNPQWLRLLALVTLVPFALITFGVTVGIVLKSL